MYYHLIVIIEDYEKACRKLKLAEVTSDLNSENELNVRRRIKPKKILESSDEEEEIYEV